MAHRSLTPLLFALCLGILAPNADAQFPFFRRFGGADDDSQLPPQLRRGMNPEQEKLKTEADKANQRGDFARAIELTDTVLQQNPRDSVAYYLRASARVELGIREGNVKRIRDGVADSREAIRYDTQRTPMYYLPYLHGMKNLAALENRRDHAETAITVANQILALPGISNDDKANLLFQRAQSEDWLGKSDPAVADCEEALKLIPTHFGARAALAEILARAKKLDQATAAFNKLVESFPESPLSYNNRGMFYQRERKYDDAIADFTRAVERDPNYYYAYTNRGFTFLETDNPVAAETDFNQSLKINPQQPMVYNLRGLAKLGHGDVAGAIQDERAVIRMNPNDPIAHGDLGFLLLFADDFSGAVQEFDAALIIDPQFRHLTPWKVAALEHAEKKENLKEAASFTALLKKDPKDRDWVEHVLAFLLGAESEADLLADANAAKDPLRNDQICEANYFIGQSRVIAGKPSAAVEAYQKAVATNARRLSAFRGAQFALRKLDPHAVKAAESAAVVPTSKVPATAASKSGAK
jgi:lipoprotein NlpI